MGLSQLSGTTASKSISLQRPTMVVFFYDRAAEKATCIPKWLAKGNTAGGMHFQVHASFQWGGFTLTVHQRVIHYEEPLIKINSHEQESTIIITKTASTSIIDCWYNLMTQPFKSPPLPGRNLPHLTSDHPWTSCKVLHSPHMPALAPPTGGLLGISWSTAVQI